MKKIFTLIAGVLVSMSASAQMISFGTKESPAAKQDTYEVDGFKLTRTDTEGKHSIDANSASFGDMNDPVKFETRLKVGGKSGAKNALTLTIPAAGTLNVYVRTASSSVTDRTLVLTQGTELYNKVVQESDVTGVIEKEDGTTTNVYAIVSVAVDAGTVDVTYPVGALNFYGFELVAGGGGTVTPSDPTPAKTWDFTSMDVSYLANNADWSMSVEGSGDKAFNRYTYKNQIDKDTYVDLASIGFSGAAGIAVGRTGGNLAANAIRVDEGQRIQLNTSNGVFKIKSLVKGDKVAIRYKSASDEERTFTVNNADVTTLVAPQSSAEGSTKEETVTVSANGDLVLTQTKAINLLAISVNEELPSASGVHAIKSDATFDTNAAMYNAAGQRVSSDYKGVVIQNGKKMLNK